MKYILGLATMGTSSAALFRDGKLIAAVEEERLSRKKNDGGFPHKAINEVLDIGNITLADIAIIAIYWQPWRIGTRFFGVLSKSFYSPLSRKNILKRIKEIFNPSTLNNQGSWADLFKISHILRSHHGNTNAKIRFIDHHLSHQLYGESMCDWKDFISLSYDGGGESYSTVLSVVENGQRKILTRHRWPNSLGHFYSTFTGFLGFKMLEGEYKMMGLAPYGKPIWKDLILKKILILNENGKYNLNTKICDYHAALNNEFHPGLESMFGPRRMPDSIPTEDHINLASSVQIAFEEALKHILKPAKKNYPNIEQLVITGGCALNVTANGKLLLNKEYREISIPPAPHDAGCSIGAALFFVKDNYDIESVRTPYLGREFSQKEIYLAILKLCKITPKKLSQSRIIEETAKLLASGNLVAWFQGKSEFGPRALGARSFLADPRQDSIRDVINDKIKKRELFRPFAPSTTEEDANKIFDIDQKSSYMNIVAKVKNKKIPAVTHVDGTARVHTISKKNNPIYHALVKKFGEITGVPVLLNTSFNIQEPIVYSPDDAIKTFIDSNVDALVIGSYIILREDLS
jgi:carbamoyltransferase